MSQPLNIMLLQAEDIGRHLGCYSDAYSHTPNLDQLAAEGTRFTNAFSHAPVCAPSRGGMVTGCYPWSIGNHHMRSKLMNPPRCFTQELRDAGYYVSWPTKLDFNFDPQEGWVDDTDAWWEKPPPADEPFFVYQNFGTTHESRMFGELPEWHSAKALDVPEHLRHGPDQAVVPPCFPDTPEIRRQLANYYDALTHIDREIGDRLAWLDEHGLRDNTIVIFLSDHGRGLPREKRWCYDAGIHEPLIVRWPGKLGPGTVEDDLVAWVDIAPTLLSVAGVAVPAHYQGQIFLGNDKAAPREYVFAGRDRMDSNFDKVRACRDKEFLYIRNDAPGLPWAQKQWYMEQQPVMPVMRDMHARGELKGHEAVFFQPEKPEEELYEVGKDPWQLNNLAGDPAFAEKKKALRAAMEANLERFGDLGDTTEEILILEELVLDKRGEYLQRSEFLPPEQVIGPTPIPMTLREAAPFLRKNGTYRFSV